jgi:Flp pilus assembly protein TadG
MSAWFCNMWRAFRRDSRANVAITFGLALIPVCGLVGAAVDYSRANAARTQLQAALDSTALMLSKEAPAMTQDQVKQKASDYFNAMFTRPDALSKQLTTTYDPAGTSITMAGSAVVNTTVSRVFGHQQIPIGSSTTVTWGSAKLRVTLVLDNTGSMLEADASGTTKISALKTAAHQFLSQMQKAASNTNDIQVAIVPFNQFVKVDAATYKNKPWIDWSLTGNNGGDGGGGSGSGSGSDGCNGGDHGGGGSGSGSGGSGSGSGSNDPCQPSKTTWNGCFTDRTEPFDVQNTTPTSANTNTYFPAVNCSMAQIMPLSSDWTALNAKVDEMAAAGMTNQTIGLVWGWHAQTGGDPLNAPALPAGTQQVIILLTDGLNTASRKYTNQASIDARTLAACTNIKTAGIQLYTVLVMSGNSSMLQQCASQSSMYFALTAANEIVTTFNQIGTKLAALRIAR